MDIFGNSLSRKHTTFSFVNGDFQHDCHVAGEQFLQFLEEEEKEKFASFLKSFDLRISNILRGRSK